MYADYFLTLARSSENEMSLFVVPKSQGLTLRHMVMSGSASAGTAYIEFDDVKIPRENLVGKEGSGLRPVMSNFNHEVRSWDDPCNRYSLLTPHAATLHQLPVPATCPDLPGGLHHVSFSVLKAPERTSLVLILAISSYVLTREAFGKKLIEQRKTHSCLSMNSRPND